MELSSFINKVQNAKNLDFGSIFSKSMELFKKTWKQGFLHFLFSMICVLPMILIIYIPIISFTISQRQSGNYGAEPPIEMLMTTGGLAIVVGMLLNTFTMAFVAGYYTIVKRIEEGKEVTAKDHFMFFNAASLKKTFVLSLMTMGITVLAMVLCYLPLFYVMIPLTFVPVVFAFNSELSESEIIKTSFSLGNKKWFITFGLLIVSGVLAELAGFVLCCVGILFTMSFIYLPVYHVYKEVIGFGEGEEDDEIYQIGIENE